MSVLDDILLPVLQADGVKADEYPQTEINIHADLEDIYTGKCATEQIQINQAGEYREYRFPLLFEQLIISQNEERDFDFTVNVYSKIHPRFLRVNQYDLLIQLEVGTTSFIHLDDQMIELTPEDGGKAGQVTVIPNLGIPLPNRSQGKLYIWWVSASEFGDGGYDPVLLEILNYGDQLNSH